MIVLNKRLPLDVKIPSKDTQIALDELESKKSKSFSSVEALFDELES